MIDMTVQINFLKKSISIIFNHLQNHIDKYEQEILRLFSSKINKQKLKQRLKYPLSSKLRSLRTTFIQRVFFPRKNNGTSKYKFFFKFQ